MATSATLHGRRPVLWRKAYREIYLFMRSLRTFHVAGAPQAGPPSTGTDIDPDGVERDSVLRPSLTHLNWGTRASSARKQDESRCSGDTLEIEPAVSPVGGCSSPDRGAPATWEGSEGSHKQVNFAVRLRQSTGRRPCSVAMLPWFAIRALIAWSRLAARSVGRTVRGLAPAIVKEVMDALYRVRQGGSDDQRRASHPSRLPIVDRTCTLMNSQIAVRAPRGHGTCARNARRLSGWRRQGR